MIRIFSKCPDCSTENSMLTLQDTRLELKMEKGDSIQLRCKNCGQNHQYSINDFRAAGPGWIPLAATLFILLELVLVFFKLFVWEHDIRAYYAMGAGVLIPGIAIALERGSQRKANAFNHHKV
jgi:hypothetical protein